MFMTLVGWLSARERLVAELSALGTRVTQLERERSALSLEHAERVTALDALVRRLSTRVQRAEAIRRSLDIPAEAAAPENGQSVLAMRRSMRGY